MPKPIATAITINIAWTPIKAKNTGKMNFHHFSSLTPARPAIGAIPADSKGAVTDRGQPCL